MRVNQIAIMKVRPCAKINLGLNVVRRRADGYHDLETVFYPVGIHDELEVTTAENVSLCVEGTDIQCPPEKNLVMRAYRLLAEHHSLPPVSIRLNKLLPSQAGMGGGSADAAFMIRLLNEQYQLGLTVSQMQQYAASIGADCAFFIESRPAYAEGIGDRLTPCEVTQLQGRWLLLVKPDVAVSTKEAYAGITPRKPLCNCLEVLRQPIDTWRQWLVNDFEESIFPKLPVLAEVKQQMYDSGAVYAAMSGSGSTIFGIFDVEPSDIMGRFTPYYNRKLKL